MKHVYLLSDAKFLELKEWIKQNCNVRRTFSDVEAEFLFSELLTVLGVTEVGVKKEK
jgi:hypothetical protein